MRSRGRLDFIAATLRAAGDGRTKTQIMYSAFLSYSQAERFVRFLIQKKLLMYEEGTGRYRRTQTGERLLRVYDGLNYRLDMDRFVGRRLGATRESLQTVRADQP